LSGAKSDSFELVAIDGETVVGEHAWVHPQ
jgi:hypothetical protein